MPETRPRHGYMHLPSPRRQHVRHTWEELYTTANIDTRIHTNKHTDTNKLTVYGFGWVGSEIFAGWNGLRWVALDWVAYRCFFLHLGLGLGDTRWTNSPVSYERFAYLIRTITFRVNGLGLRLGLWWFWMLTTSCGNLVVPRTRRRIGNRAFSVAAPRAWNRLPTELKLLRSTVLFRRDLKTFLFHSIYGH